MDLGGQYANDPFDASGGVRSITGLSATLFVQQVQPVLAGAVPGVPPATSARHGQRQPRPAQPLVLTGDAEGDFNVVLTLVNDACNAAANPLLARPSTAPHPAGATRSRRAAGGQCRATQRSPPGSSQGCGR
jgi:hypothetical protein